MCEVPELGFDYTKKDLRRAEKASKTRENWSHPLSGLSYQDLFTNVGIDVPEFYNLKNISPGRGAIEEAETIAIEQGLSTQEVLVNSYIRSIFVPVDLSQPDC